MAFHELFPSSMDMQQLEKCICSSEEIADLAKVRERYQHSTYEVILSSIAKRLSGGSISKVVCTAKR